MARHAVLLSPSLPKELRALISEWLVTADGVEFLPCDQVVYCGLFVELKIHMKGKHPWPVTIRAEHILAVADMSLDGHTVGFLAHLQA